VVVVGVREWVGDAVFVGVRVAVEITVEVGVVEGAGVWVCVGLRVWVKATGDVSVVFEAGELFEVLQAGSSRTNMRHKMVDCMHRCIRPPVHPS